MTFFFDRDVGVRLPRSLKILLPTPIEYHQSHFPTDSPDDEWMSEVGGRGWTVIGHDGRHHHRSAELSAIKQYQMGCFYLWGHSVVPWEKALCFLRAYREILDAMNHTPRPYIYRVDKVGHLEPVTLP